MTTQVIQTGASVRVIVQSRGIASTTINGAGHLIITYDDGTTQDAGVTGGGTPTPPPTGTPSLDFSSADNSGYLVLLAA